MPDKQKGCFFYVDEQGSIKAICIKCSLDNPKGWPWPADAGFGDYDLKCENCKEHIHKRKNAKK